MSGSSTDLLVGLATCLDDAGIGLYRPSAVYESTDLAIVFNLSPQTPDNCIVLTTYRLRADPYPTASGLEGVQFRTRSLTRAGERDLQDAIYQNLHGLEDQQYGSIHVAVLLWSSAVPLDQDDSHRWGSTSNYYATVDYQPTVRRPD